MTTRLPFLCLFLLHLHYHTFGTGTHYDVFTAKEPSSANRFQRVFALPNSPKCFSGRSATHQKATFPLLCFKKLLMLLKPFKVLRELQIHIRFPQGAAKKVCTSNFFLQEDCATVRKCINSAIQKNAKQIRDVPSFNKWGFRNEKPEDNCFIRQRQYLGGTRTYSFTVFKSNLSSPLWRKISLQLIKRKHFPSCGPRKHCCKSKIIDQNFWRTKSEVVSVQPYNLWISCTWVSLGVEDRVLGSLWRP